MVFIKKTTIILFLLLLLVIAGGSVDIPDYDAYEAMYVHDIEYPNRLYGYISDWFAYSGFDFNVFRLVWGVTALVGIFYPVRQLLNEKQQIIFIVLFMVSQFWVEIMQVRNFMVVSLFSISFYILLKQKILT